MIPKVKRYRVSYWKGTALLHVLHVTAPTKYLARLAVRFDHHLVGKPGVDWDRVTYYVERTS